MLAHEVWVNAPGNEQLAVGPDRLFHRGVQYLEGEVADPSVDTGLPVILGEHAYREHSRGFDELKSEMLELLEDSQDVLHRRGCCDGASW